MIKKKSYQLSAPHSQSETANASGAPIQRLPSRAIAGAICALVSLGLHGIFLVLPTPQQTNQVHSDEPEPAASETMPVVRLPAVSPSPASPSPEPAASQPPAPAPTPAAPPAPAPPPGSPEPPAPRPVPRATPPTTPAAPTPPPESSPQTSPAPTPPEPYADFPHLLGPTIPCEDRSNCWRSQASSWRSAAQDLESDLESQGYELNTVTEETGVRIYAVQKNGAVEYYLNLVSIAGGIWYTLSDQPLSADELSEIERF